MIRSPSGAWVACTVLFGVQMGMGSTEELAARLALVALRAGLSNRGQSTGERYEFHPDTVALTQTQAARILADLPKPIRCEGSVSGGAVVVRCQQISDPALLEMQRKSAKSALQVHVQEIRGMSATSEAEPNVLVYGYLEAALLPLSAIETWFRDYRVVPYAMAVRPATAIARSKGASAVIDFAQGDFRIIADSLEQDDW